MWREIKFQSDDVVCGFNNNNYLNNRKNNLAVLSQGKESTLWEREYYENEDEEEWGTKMKTRDEEKTKLNKTKVLKKYKENNEQEVTNRIDGERE